MHKFESIFSKKSLDVSISKWLNDIIN